MLLKPKDCKKLPKKRSKLQIQILYSTKNSDKCICILTNKSCMFIQISCYSGSEHLQNISRFIWLQSNQNYFFLIALNTKSLNWNQIKACNWMIMIQITLLIAFDCPSISKLQTLHDKSTWQYATFSGLRSSHKWLSLHFQDILRELERNQGTYSWLKAIHQGWDFHVSRMQRIVQLVLHHSYMELIWWLVS